MNSTKLKLIKAAIQLYSENNIESLSVQKINEMAKVSNKSALYYHFKSKSGLVEAALDHILDSYVHEVEYLIQQIDEDTVQVSEVIDALMTPMIKMLLEENGVMKLKFFSKVISAGDEGRIWVSKKVGPASIIAVDLICKALPQANPDEISLKILFTFNTLINIVSDVGIENFWPTKIKDRKEIGKYLKNFIEGGLIHSLHQK
ncbi:hypothetical protein F993_02369 [Acinetobacter proteolyticus]|jgi:AcrR family transcriptional regulator|uniref:TetR/AcrR family transcriptional regulator n=2 Tax=Acinetobacter TaxID=469 RepID=A0AA42I9F2_9GAMM|nr:MULTISPECIES: TetR/AcrR family transcriptional regulator [Acinetobacter]ENU23221.1 hypothetical protein F993_02369 [Acinetobacter proteolyticus]MCU4641147.1 TetR/AcrR family transcriptional regulator [Acinetobacter courvalinii]MDH0563772.1 TetR/AcrR family transcriptional regulator [Acinetobacter courvalinii]MEB3789930.1 TetR/AcrR family transcriptional regulator [Acinetobacter sp. IK40]